MFSKDSHFQISGSIVLIAAFLLAPVSTAAQDLVAVSSITGSSSVFVFGGGGRAPRRTPAAKPARSKAQRIDSVTKIKTQYETTAKVNPRREKAKVVDPYNLPKNIKTLPAAQGSKLFAGVGEYYIEHGEYAKSLDFFRDAVTLDPKNTAAKSGLSEALAINGTDLLVKDKASEAKGVFMEALKYNPNNSAAYFGLGEVYSELEQYTEAIDSYEKSLANDKDLTEIYVPLGILYYQSGDIAKADQILTKALAFSAGSAETQFFLGLVRSAQNRNTEALAAFQEAKRLDPTMAEAYHYTGEILVRLKRSDEAIAEYQKAITLKANYFDAYLGLGEAFYDTGKYADAITAYKAATKLKNDNWEVFAGLADAYRQTNSFNDAVANYNLAALFLTRTKDFDKIAAADLYSKAGYAVGRQCEINLRKFVACNWPGAVQSLEKALELGGRPLDNANLGWAYYNAARVDIDAKQPDLAKPKLELARSNLQKALSAGDPKIADGVLQNLGAVQVDLGDFKGAIESLKQIVDKRKDWNFSRYALGTAYFKVNDFDNAAKMFRVAVDKEPNNASMLSSLGYAEIKLKNGKEVRKIIDRLKPLSLPAALKLEQEAKIAKLPV